MPSSSSNAFERIQQTLKAAFATATDIAEYPTVGALLADETTMDLSGDTLPKSAQFRADALAAGHALASTLASCSSSLELAIDTAQKLGFRDLFFIEVTFQKYVLIPQWALPSATVIPPPATLSAMVHHGIASEHPDAGAALNIVY